MNFADDLKRLHACSEAVAWVGARDLGTAWAECEHGEWMLWLVGRVDIDRKMLVRAAVECARPALRYVPAGEDRPRYALEVTLAWCEGRATLAEVRAAAYAADAAAAYAVAAAAYADAAAAHAAAYAAYAADAAADAADAAYADAAAAHADAAARSRSLRESADTVRRLIPVETIRAALEGK